AKNHGITNVAILDRAYIGAGGSGRNTAIVRSNYRTAEGVPFYDESVKLYEDMAGELGYNVMFSQHGHLTLAHTDRGINTLRDGGAGSWQPSIRDVCCKIVLNATAGWASTITKMVNVDIPIVTHPLQALVTETLKPFLDQFIVSATLHIYVNQTDRGELVIGQ